MPAERTGNLPGRRCFCGRKEHIGMQVLRSQATCRSDLHSSFDHRWWPGDIGFPAIKILQVVGNGIGHEAVAPARFRRSIGEDRREAQVRVPLRQPFEVVHQIEIAFAARAKNGREPAASSPGTLPLRRSL